MTTARTDELMATLQRFFNPGEEGWVWLALYREDNEQGVLSQIEGEHDEVAPTARALAQIINEAGADRAYLALCRWDGRPTEADRELWRLLDRLVSAESLTDMVVFNAGQRWSMRTDNVIAA